MSEYDGFLLLTFGFVMGVIAPICIPSEGHVQQARGFFFLVFGKATPPERGDNNHDRALGVEPRYYGRFLVLGDLPLEQGLETIYGYTRPGTVIVQLSAQVPHHLNCNRTTRTYRFRSFAN